MRILFYQSVILRRPDNRRSEMWFKNLVVFRIEEGVKIDAESLEHGLEQHQFKPCGPQQPEALGWTPPMGGLSDQLYHSGSGKYLLTAKREERILPATVIKDALSQKVQEIEKKEDRKLGRKQKMEMRDQLVFEMMPKAFTRSNRIQGMILPDERLIAVDCASRKRAEEWLSLLRMSLGTLPVKPIEFKRSPGSQFTGWLSGAVSMPAQINLGDECVLQSQDEVGSVIRCRKLDLSGKEIRAHLDAGKLATQLSLEWNQSLMFVLNEDGDLKRLRFSDTVVEQSEADGVDDPAAEFDARFTLLGLELSRFLPELWKAMGGLSED